VTYFERTGERHFRATEHTGGAWREDEQHVAPALGLLAHVVDRDRRGRREDPFVAARLSYDIFGTVPVDEVEVAVRVLRPGRTIELVQAELAHGGRTIVLLRVWLLEPRDTADHAGTPFAPLPSRDELTPWSPANAWPGGFIRSVELHRHLEEPGRGWFWARPLHPLVADEEVSSWARAAGLLDLANGMTVRADPAEVHFPNIDLTAHLLREPLGEWLGVDASVTFGRDGVGMTSARLHDDEGPLGTLVQCLTVRPR
jgi:acyl-CoA thioesterase